MSYQICYLHNTYIRAINIVELVYIETKKSFNFLLNWFSVSEPLLTVGIYFFEKYLQILLDTTSAKRKMILAFISNLVQMGKKLTF